MFKGTPMLLHYVTSKGAVVAMTRCLARDLGDDGIRVNTLAPGLAMSDTVIANPAWKGAVMHGNTAIFRLRAAWILALRWKCCQSEDRASAQFPVSLPE